MATNTLYTCDRCRSAEHTTEYRLEASNFSQLNISLYPVAGGPLMPGGGTAVRNDTFQICNDCKAAIEASINEIVNPLKAS